MTILIPAWVDGKIQPIEKLEVHSHKISKLLENLDDPDNDIMLVQLRIEITEEFDRRGHIPLI